MVSKQIFHVNVGDIQKAFNNVIQTDYLHSTIVKVAVY